MEHTFRSRLVKIESALRKRELEEESESRFPIKRIFEQAMKTMRYQDRQEFVEIVTTWLDSASKDHRTILPPMIANVIEPSMHKPPRPYYFGPEVFDIYKQREGAMVHECGDCGCMYPKDVVQECQLCGGKVGKDLCQYKPPKRQIEDWVYNEVEIRLLHQGR